MPGARADADSQLVLKLEQPDDSDGRGNRNSAEDIALGAILNCSCQCTNITVSHTQNQLMHSHIINITLLTLCHCDMFRPSNGHLQGVQLIHFNGKVKGQIKIQLITEDGPLRAETCHSDNSINTELLKTNVCTNRFFMWNWVQLSTVCLTTVHRKEVTVDTTR